jgi:hypothetical protein
MMGLHQFCMVDLHHSGVQAAALRRLNCRRRSLCLVEVRFGKPELQTLFRMVRCSSIASEGSLHAIASVGPPPAHGRPDVHP